MKIYDTAGQEKYRSITETYLKGNDVALLVYDIGNKESFENISSYWINKVKNNDTQQETLMVLVGNKCDLLEEREVSFEEGQILAEEKGMLFYETSAKNGDNVEKLFQENAAKAISKKMKNDIYHLENDIEIKKVNEKNGRDRPIKKLEKEKEKKGCCSCE